MPGLAVGAPPGPRPEPPTLLRVRTWPTPPDGRHVFHHRPDSAYVLNCWTCVLGPTATLLYRHVGNLVTRSDSGVIFSRADLAASLGLGAKLSRNGPFERALDRLERYGAARWTGDVFEVREALADLSARMVDRAPTSVHLLHDMIVADRHQGPSQEVLTAERGQVPAPPTLMSSAQRERSATVFRHPSVGATAAHSLVRRI